MLDIPYDQRALGTAFGAEWFQGIGWAYVGTTLPAPLRHYRPKAYSWGQWLEDDYLGTHSALDPAPEPDTGTGTFTLRKDQLLTARSLLELRHAGGPEFLVGSDVGTGKTAAVISAVKRMSNVRNVLVIAPLSVLPGWRLHLRDMGDGGMRWCLINYQSVKKLLEPPASAQNAKRTRTKNLHTASKGTPKVQWDVVISDECHYRGNPESQQTRAIDRIIMGPNSRPAFVIDMSATPGSDPSDLSYLHRGFYWRSGLRPRPTITAEEYMQWCEANGFSVTKGRFGNSLTWDGGQDELSRLHKMLYGFSDSQPRWARRMRPDWPEQQRIAYPVELSPEQQDAYEADWAEFKSAMKAIEKAKQARSTKKMSASARAKANAADRAKGLAAQTRYRQKAGQVRAEGTAQFVAELVAKGRQVAISCEYIGTVDALVEHLTALKVPVTTFTGQNPDQREDNRIAYQRGQFKAIIFTPTEGFNLHAGDHAVSGNDVPRVTVVAEPRWSPKKALQAEGRCILEGQSVLTARGHVKIEEVQEGDLVLTHLGHWKPVSAVMSRGVDRSPRERLTSLFYEGSQEPLVSTSDHRIWVRRRGSASAGWVKASQVLPGDFLLSPAATDDDTGLEFLAFPDECRTYDVDAFSTECADCGRPVPLTGRGRCANCYARHIRAIRLPDGSLPDFTRAPNGRHIPAPERVVVDDQFLDFAGWYLAEGFSGIKSTGTGKAISLSGHVDEREVLESHGRYLKRTFGINWKVFEGSGGNSLELRAWGSDLAQWLHEDFGHRAHNKHLPHWFWQLSKDQQWRMLTAYFSGDGHDRAMPNGRPSRGWVTASSRLHCEIMSALSMLGYKPSGWRAPQPKEKRKIDGREINQGEHWQGEFALDPLLSEDATRVVVSDAGAWRRVKEVQTRFAKKADRVWDLTVECDHSFIVGLVAVHNSQRNATEAPVYYTFALDTVEEKVIRRVIEGMKNTTAVHGEDTSSFDGLAEALSVPFVMGA